MADECEFFLLNFLVLVVVVSRFWALKLIDNLKKMQNDQKRCKMIEIDAKWSKEMQKTPKKMQKGF